MNRVLRLLPAAALLVPLAATAQNPPPPPPPPAPVAAAKPAAPAPVVSPFRLTLDVGAVNASGNTNVTTLNLGDGFDYHSKAGGFSQFANVIYGRIGDSVTAEQIKAGLKVEHRLWMVVHGYVSGTYERNRFAGIDRRFTENAGLEIHLLDLPRDLWTFETGSALTQDQSTPLIYAGVLSRITHNFLALRFATTIRHNFTQTAYLSESAEGIPSVDNTQDYRINSETALVAPISTRLALKIDYIVKYQNIPEPGFQKSDRLLSSGVQVAF